mmetsp:Transcript_61766/g.180496  ORF Transcript_61766/g.180496 Transcript_61766/m.180496 type:complete len:270 (+) Transcript_61766:54-863(+)
MESFFLVTAGGQSTEFCGELTKVTVLDVKLKYNEVANVPVWQQRLVLGTDILEDDLVLASCGVGAGTKLQLVMTQNLSDLPGLGTGWVLYMFNGKDAQHRDSLRYGSNPDGLGDPGVVLDRRSDLRGCYKMSESSFHEHRFTEVAAVGSDQAWVLIRRSDGGAIPAADAFSTGSSEGYQFTLSNGSTGDSSTNRTNASWDNMHWARFGPFFDDPSYCNSLDGSGWQWMWSEDREDKGTVLGSAHVLSKMQLEARMGGYAWAWYGRAPDG